MLLVSSLFLPMIWIELSSFHFTLLNFCLFHFLPLSFHARYFHVLPLSVHILSLSLHVMSKSSQKKFGMHDLGHHGGHNLCVWILRKNIHTYRNISFRVRAISLSFLLTFLSCVFILLSVSFHFLQISFFQWSPSRCENEMGKAGRKGDGARQVKELCATVLCV